MRPSTRLCAGSLAACLLFLAAPSAWADEPTLADVTIKRVRLTSSGVVKVNVAYVCPAGYTPTRRRAFVFVAQNGDPAITRQRSFTRDATCDGQTHHAVVSFPEHASEPWYRNTPMQIIANIDACQVECIQASDSDTVLLT